MEIALYILKSSVIFSLLYLCYHFVFSKTTFFQINRFYLLLLIPVSLIFPFIETNSELITNSIFVVQLPVMEISSQQTTDLPVISVIFWMYGLITTLLLMQYLASIIKLLWLIKQLKRNKKTNVAAFSFFNFIYIPHEADENTRQFIFSHEKIHALQWHSLDVMLYELYKRIFWFNPLAWVALKNVTANHEYIADNIISKENQTAYFDVMLAQVFGLNSIGLVNNFNNQLLIKKRIAMMTSKKTNRMFLWNYLMIIPIVFIAITGTTTLNAQESNAKKVTKAKKIDGEVYNVVDKMPEYKGGMDALMSYLSSNITYPEAAKNDKIEGKVFVSYVINEQGKVTQVKVERGVNKLLDDEAIRVVKKMPDWIPGEHQGKKVKVKMNLPISFKLDDKK